MISIKTKLNFRMNYVASKLTTALQISYNKYLDRTCRVTLTPKSAPWI